MSERNRRDVADRIKQEAEGLLLDDFAGRKQWKGSKFGYVTGLSLVSGVVSGITGAVGASAGRVGGLYSAMMSREDTSALPSIDEAETDASRRFDLAMEAHGKTDADLEAIAANSYRGFFLYAILLLGVVVLGIGSLRYGNISGLPRPLDVALRFALAPALGALMIRFGYLNWIVRNRQLGGLPSYLLSGGFFPVKALRKAVLVLVLASMSVGWLGVGSTPAYAASDKCIAGSPGTPGNASEVTAIDLLRKPNCDDVFYNMLRFVAPGVGPIDDKYMTNAHKAVADGFTAFSGVLMLIASMMLGWHVLAGIVQSAYSGKVLGERWHQIWAPSRVVLGVGSLAPVAGGYGAAQVLVIYLVVWGSNLANTIWVPYVTTVGGGVRTVTSSSAPPQTASEQARSRVLHRVAGAEDIVYQIARREVCNAVANKYLDGSIPGGARGSADEKAIVRNPSPTMVADPGYPVVEWVKSTFDDAFSWLADKAYSTGTFIQKGLKDNVGVDLPAAAVPQKPTKVTTTRYAIDYGTACGKISIDVDTVKEVGDVNRLHSKHAIGEALFDQKRKVAIEEAVAALRGPAKAIAATYVRGSNKAMAFSGTESAQNELRNFYTAVEDAAKAYGTSMYDAAKDQIQNLDTNNANGASLVGTLTSQLGTKGWAVAGTYYVTLSNVQSAIYSKASEKPSFVGLDLSPSEGMRGELAQTLVGNEGQPGAVRAFDDWWKKSAGTAFVGLDPLAAKAGSSDEDSSNWFNSLLESLGADGMLPGALAWFKDLDPFNPMRSMTEFGHHILLFFYSLMGALAALAFAGKVIGWIKSGVSWIVGSESGGQSSGGAKAGMFASLITTFLGLLLIGLFSVGVVHAYIIPMIPYLQVLFFLMGMLILVVEALIAAPLWAFFHVRMDGQDFVDQVQRPGYMIAFNLLLRPSLMILGLMMSLFVFGAMAWFVSHTFTSAAVAAGSGHSVGPIGTIVMICIVCYLHFQIALRSFGLINQVPDRVVRWFGQGGEQLGDDRENDKAVGFAVGKLGGKSEELVSGAGLGALVRKTPRM